MSVRGVDVRMEICRIISRMLDNPNKYGIYPTTNCYDELSVFIQQRDLDMMRKGWEAAREEEIDRMGYLDSSEWHRQNVYETFEEFIEREKEEK